MNLDQFLQTQITSNDIVLDIGSGNKQHQKFKCDKIISIDAWDKVEPDIIIDLNENRIPFEDKSIDVILMIDFIEHIEKQQGINRIKESKCIARKKIILLTPLWWDDNKTNTDNHNLWCYNNPFNYHKSLWTLDDFTGWERKVDIDGLENYFFGVYNVK